MTQRNLLLGGGEALTSKSDIKRNPSDKKWPYTIADVREALKTPLDNVEKAIDQLPSEAKPRQEGVFQLTLHPAFLGRSYYPTRALNQSGLRDVGSKEVEITPRESTRESRAGKPQATASLYVAGSASDVQKFSQLLFADKIPQTVKSDFLKIESIAWVEPTQKIKGDIPQDDEQRSFEIALHAGADEADIVAAFATFARRLSAPIDLTRRLCVGGLTFLPVTTTGKIVHALATFTFVRVIRPMAEIRMAVPSITRQTISGPSPTLPPMPAIDGTQRVAIFDGGLGTADLSRWAREVTYEETRDTRGELLLHGSEVTSTYLFGHQTTNQLLGRPYTNVDHFRVLSPLSGRDPDLFDVLHRIKGALDTGAYKFANLSIGPRMPVADDEVHAWTATLDQLCARHGILVTVAVGNDGEFEGANRIQPPSDMVNAIAVGSASSPGEKWKRAPYSCVGPGRSPGYVKPDGVAFGGTVDEPFKVFNPILGGFVGVQGTSYSSPLTLRTAVGTAVSTTYDMSSIALKALLVHRAERKPRLKRDEIGWGRFAEDPMQLLQCESESATVIFQGPLAKGQYRRCPIPFPNTVLQGEIQITATLCIQAHTDPEHSVNYTRAGMGVVFRPQFGLGNTGSTEFFGRSSQYKASERELRDGAHKWETCLHRSRTFDDASNLVDPVFDIEYHARMAGRGIPLASAPDVHYALVVTITAKGVPELYDLIRQRYPVLLPVELNVDLDVDAANL